MSSTLTLLSDFRVILPKYRGDQDTALAWLAAAHTRAEPESAAQLIRKLVERFGCGSDRIGFRYSELEDFTHLDWERMRIFSATADPAGRGAGERSRFYSEVVNSVFERFYAEDTAAPETMIHVTCTGYVSPSGAQRLIASRDWGHSTEVLHAYHMGCYAALPATFMAQGLLASGKKRVDLVHTELCTLHLNPTLHTPEQMVVQSLFSDGLIRYTAAPELDRAQTSGLALLASLEEIIPDTETQMTWEASDHGMNMTLSREVPKSIASMLPSFVERLAALAGLTSRELRRDAIFAIHPGGPRIIDQVQDCLQLASHQVQASNTVLKERGNMSSATLPHIWKLILEEPKVVPGTRVVSLAFGPGLTVSASVFEKRVRS